MIEEFYYGETLFLRIPRTLIPQELVPHVEYYREDYHGQHMSEDWKKRFKNTLKEIEESGKLYAFLVKNGRLGLPRTDEETALVQKITNKRSPIRLFADTIKVIPVEKIERFVRNCKIADSGATLDEFIQAVYYSKTHRHKVGEIYNEIRDSEERIPDAAGLSVRIIREIDTLCKKFNVSYEMKLMPKWWQNVFVK